MKKGGAMPVVYGESVWSVEEIVDAFRRHGDRVRGTYRAHYRFDPGMRNPYSAPRLERPDSLRDNPPDVIYPWEQILLAAHFGVALDRVDFVVEGVFDPRDEFDGLAGYSAPNDARHCYRTLHLSATVVSPAPRSVLERIHARVISDNMV